MTPAAAVIADPVLGDLSVITDPGAAAAGLGAAFAGRTVTAARRRDTKYRPRERCQAVYELDLTGPGGPRRDLGVLTLTAGGLAARRFDADPALPALAEALDPGRMAARLAAVVPGLTGCTPSPVRYKPEARCVLRYELATAAGPLELYGKLLAGGVDELVTTIAALHSAAGGGLPAVPPLTAAWPDLGLVLQPAVAGAELHERAFDPAVPGTERLALLGSAGRGLAALHATALPGLRPATQAGDLAELRGYLSAIGRLDPALGERYAEVLAGLEQAGPDRAQPPATGHGAMRTDQFLLDRATGGLVLIDLDGVCLAEPARDLGNLLAYLDWKAIRRPGDAAWLTRAADAFVAGYATAGPVAHERVAAYRAGSLLKIAGRRYRSLTVREWPLVPALVDAAAALSGLRVRR
jgi:hypothetical protein